MDDEGQRPFGDEAAEPGGFDDPLRRDADDLRRLIDAGASSPEELRALAERIREHKALEQARWRSDVKPDLLASKKWRNRIKRSDDQRDDAAGDEEVRRNLKIGAALLGGALLLFLLATQSGVLFVLLPVVGVVVYAYRQGRREGSGEDLLGPLDPPVDPPADPPA